MKFTFKIEQVSVSNEDTNVVIEGINLTIDMSVDELAAAANSSMDMIKTFVAAAESNSSSNVMATNASSSSTDTDNNDDCEPSNEEFVAYVLYRKGVYAAFGNEGWTFTHDPQQASLFDTVEKAELRQRCTPQFALFDIVRRVKKEIN